MSAEQAPDRTASQEPDLASRNPKALQALRVVLPQICQLAPNSEEYETLHNFCKPLIVAVVHHVCRQAPDATLMELILTDLLSNMAQCCKRTSEHGAKAQDLPFTPLQSSLLAFSQATQHPWTPAGTGTDGPPAILCCVDLTRTAAQALLALFIPALCTLYTTANAAWCVHAYAAHATGLGAVHAAPLHAIPPLVTCLAKSLTSGSPAPDPTHCAQLQAAAAVLLQAHSWGLANGQADALVGSAAAALLSLLSPYGLDTFDIPPPTAQQLLRPCASALSCHRCTDLVTLLQALLCSLPGAASLYEALWDLPDTALQSVGDVRGLGCVSWAQTPHLPPDQHSSLQEGQSCSRKRRRTGQAPLACAEGAGDNEARPAEPLTDASGGRDGTSSGLHVMPLVSDDAALHARAAHVQRCAWVVKAVCALAPDQEAIYMATEQLDQACSLIHRIAQTAAPPEHFGLSVSAVTATAAAVLACTEMMVAGHEAKQDDIDADAFIAATTAFCQALAELVGSARAAAFPSISVKQLGLIQSACAASTAALTIAVRIPSTGCNRSSDEAGKIMADDHISQAPPELSQETYFALHQVISTARVVSSRLGTSPPGSGNELDNFTAALQAQVSVQVESQHATVLKSEAVWLHAVLASCSSPPCRLRNTLLPLLMMQGSLRRAACPGAEEPLGTHTCAVQSSVLCYAMEPAVVSFLDPLGVAAAKVAGVEDMCSAKHFGQSLATGACNPAEPQGRMPPLYAALGAQFLLCGFGSASTALHTVLQMEDGSGHAGELCWRLVAAAEHDRRSAGSRAGSAAVSAQGKTAVQAVKQAGERLGGLHSLAVAAAVAAVWWRGSAAMRSELLCMLVPALGQDELTERSAAADLLVLLAHWEHCSLLELIVAHSSLLTRLVCQAANNVKVLQSLADIAGAASVEDLAAAVIPGCMGELCRQLDAEGIGALAAIVGQSVTELLTNHLPVILSHGLWQSHNPSEPDAGVIHFTQSLVAFLEQLLRSGSESLDDLLRSLETMHCTKLEVVYEAAKPMGPGRAGPGMVSNERIALCRGFLGVLQALQGRQEPGGGWAVRDLLPLEAVEFFIQLLGKSIRTDVGAQEGVVSSTGSTAREGHGWLDSQQQLELSRGARRGAGLGTAGAEKGRTSKAVATSSTTSLRRDPSQCVCTLALLMELLGAEVGAHTVKFMAALAGGMEAAAKVAAGAQEASGGSQSLRTASTFRAQVIRAWHQLVHCLGAHARDLLPLVAPQTVSHLLTVLTENAEGHVLRHGMGGQPGQETWPGAQADVEAALQLLEELIVRNAAVLGPDVLAALPPLPDGLDLPGLSNIRKVIETSHRRRSFSCSVEVLARNIHDQAASIRFAALGNLSRLLASSPSKTTDMLLEEIPAPPPCRVAPLPSPTVICQLMQALLRSCDLAFVTVASQGPMHERLGICLGQLGALDPSRVQLELTRPSAIVGDEQELLCQLLKHVLRILRTAQHLDVVDHSTYALHTLLKQYAADGHGTDLSTSGMQAIMGKLDNVEKQLVELNLREFGPGLRSLHASKNQLSLDVCVIEQEDKMSFRRWLDRWIRQLLQRCPAGKTTNMFHAVSLAQRYDVSFMLFLLPRVLFSALTAKGGEATNGHGPGEDAGGGGHVDAAAACSAVLREMAAVVQRCCPSEDLQASSSTNLPPAALHLQAILSVLQSLSHWSAEASIEIGSLERVDARGNRTLAGGSDPAKMAKVSRLRKQVSAVLGVFNKLLLPRASDDCIVSMDRLAIACHWCGADGHALRHYETWIRHHKPHLRNRARDESEANFTDVEVTNLMQIYKGLQDPDALAGLATLRSGGPCNSDWILAAEQVGQWSAAAALYEVQGVGHNSSPAASARPGSSGMSVAAEYLRTFLGDGKLRVMRALADGSASRAASDAQRSGAAAAGAAASWRLGDWDSLARFLHIVDSAQDRALGDVDAWEVTLGRALLLCQNRNPTAAHALLERERVQTTIQMGPAGLESYARAHPLMVKLHMLYDLEELGCRRCLPAGRSDGAVISEALHSAAQRVKQMMVDIKSHTDMLALLRALAHVHGKRDVVAELWLQHAKACQARQHYEAAWAGVLEAESMGHVAALKLKAKLLWDRAAPPDAIRVLQSGLERLEAARQSCSNGDKIYWRSRLKLLSWMVEQGIGETSQLREGFQKIVEAKPADDKAHMEYARFLGKVYQNLRHRQLSAAGLAVGTTNSVQTNLSGLLPEDDPNTYIDFVAPLIKQYGQVMVHGEKRVFQALPRLLTLIVEFGSDVVKVMDAPRKDTGTSVSLVERVSRAMSQQKEAIRVAFETQRRNTPAWKLLPGIPQAVSCLGHPSSDMLVLIQRMIAFATKAYPNHCLWMLQAVSQSDTKERKESATTVLKHVRDNAAPDVLKMMLEHESLCTGLRALANWNAKQNRMVRPISKEKADTFSVQTAIPSLATVRDTSVLIPTLGAFESSFSAVLQDRQTRHESVTVAGIHNEFSVMASASSPKRIHFLGSDGHKYRFLAKPQDDLRRDMRVMEYACLLNRLWREEPETSRRALKLQTFMCLPLADRVGLVEWVLNTSTYSKVVRETYVKQGVPYSALSPGQLKPAWDIAYKAALSGNPGTQGATVKWIKERLAVAPPVLHEWWLTMKPDPAAWLQARTTFTRSTAAWSMAGHVVGLGDRHCDNLLIDLVSGCNVQIDFGHLFDSGCELPIPEIVPFRLTQNIVDSFGVCGVEGTFRISCITVLQSLRNNQEVITGLLQAIVTDPFYEWTAGAHGTGKLGRSSKGKANKSAHSLGNAKALVAMAVIQGRLQGVLAGARKKRRRQMTVDAQVDFLLNEAQDIDNLSRMYIGWLPFL